MNTLFLSFPNACKKTCANRNLNLVVKVLMLLCLVPLKLFPQTTLQGKVTDAEGALLCGANVWIKGSFDGASTKNDGTYSFMSVSQGKQTLLVSYIGYRQAEKEVDLQGGDLLVDLVLEPEKKQVGDVVITAGTFEAGDKKKSVTLQPLDIVTTPSAAGDLYGALTSLPGTTLVGEDGRLFVRGGDGYESKTFIDGLLVKNPYSTAAPDLPSRGRFSPFLFSGTMFSTGGYSAEYGQALSAALILTTNAFPQKTQTDITLMTVGQGLTQTIKTDRSAFSLGCEYMNLQPYYSVVRQNIDWKEFPRSITGTLTGRFRTKGDGIIKVFSNFKSGGYALMYPDMTTEGSTQEIKLHNNNNYTNVCYSGTLGHGWIVKTGMAFTYNADTKSFRTFDVDDYNENLEVKLTLKKKMTDNLTLLLGGEEVSNHYKEVYNQKDTAFTFTGTFYDHTPALYAEAEAKPFARLAIRAGLRGEYSSLLNKPALAIRTSAAWAFNDKLQASFAYGSFYQTPEETLLRFTHHLDFEKADHYIANIQYEANDRIFRFECYYKKYTSLVLYDENQYYRASAYNNNGNGYSRGIDIFYRDRKSIKNLDYWISYSFLDAQRYYRTNPSKATPTFAAKHSFSVVAKQWISSITTQCGMAFTWASGRPYNNPNSTVFMGEHTRNYADLSVNISYLTSIFKKSTIVYTSLSNILGRHNIYGYRYYQTPDGNGEYRSMPVESEAKRFFMIGLFITL
jgi:hypothetical protein